jgi:hypothetical protein
MKSLSLKEKPETNQTEPGMKVEDETIFDCSKFCIEAGFDHLNLNSLVQFCDKTKLPQKLIDFKPVKVEVTPVENIFRETQFWTGIKSKPLQPRGRRGIKRSRFQFNANLGVYSMSY